MGDNQDLRDVGAGGLLTREELLKAALAGGAALGAASFLGVRPAAAASLEALASPRRGGTLRVGISGGSANDSISAYEFRTAIDHARSEALYNPLLRRDRQFRIEKVLAQEVTSNKRGDVWTVRIKDGVEFHNGKTLDADDVVYSLRRYVDPKVESPVYGELSPFLGLGGIRKLDKRTVRLTLKRPNAVFDANLSNEGIRITSVGFDPKAPVGTGPFKFSRFTPGQESLFTANPNYFKTGPYVDELQIINFTDATARVNALLAGQVDAIDGVPYAQLPIIRSKGKVLLNSKTGGFRALIFNLQTPQLRDNRVRRALRLLIDRPQLVRQAFAGQARVANDLAAPDDPVYNRRIPQIRRDVQQARSLLRAAGRSDLRLDLYAKPTAAGEVEMATTIAEQVRAGGVNIRVNQVEPGAFYDRFGKWPFTTGWFPTQSFWSMTNQVYLPQAFFNAMHYNSPAYMKVYNQALRSTNPNTRRELAQEAQRLMHNDNPVAIPVFVNQIDAYSESVTGFLPNRNGMALNQFSFELISFK